jgi:uncharacterized protein (DUF302 family)
MSEDQPESILYAEPGAAAAAFQGIRTSRAPFTEVIWRLREAIEAAEFWILQEVNSQMLLKRGGYAAAPVRQLMFFHPRFMVRILEVDPAAMLEVPLKMAVLELPDSCVRTLWQRTAARSRSRIWRRLPGNRRGEPPAERENADLKPLVGRLRTNRQKN